MSTRLRCWRRQPVLRGAAVLAAAVMVLFGTPGAAAQSSQRPFPLGHPVYDALASAYRHAGQVLPEVTVPASRAQLRYYLGLLEQTALPPTAAAYARTVREHLDGDEGPAPVFVDSDTGFAMQLAPAIGLEARLDRTPIDERLLDRPVDLLTVDGRLSLGPFFGEMQLHLGQEPYHGEYATANPTNIPSQLMLIDSNAPRRAHLATGGEHWSFQIGRDRLSFGTSRSGSLTMSGAADYLEFMRFTAYSRTFAYTGVFLRLEPWVDSSAELPATGPYVPPYILGGSPSANYRVWRKSIVVHRFTWRPGPRLRFSIMESASMGGYAPDLRMFNPFMILHSHYDFTLMAFAASAELTVAPLPGLELYGQWYMNDFLLPQEAEAGATEPNAMAWLAGWRLDHPLTARPLVLSLGGEIYHGDPYVYVRESVLRSFTYRHRVHTNYDGSGGIALGRITWEDGFLGSAYGNDARAIVAFAGLEAPSWALADVELLLLEAGELGVTDIVPGTPEASLERTPTGVPERTTRLTARLRVSSDGLPGAGERSLVAEASLAGRLQWTANQAHAEGDNTFRAAASLTLGLRWRGR